jgi:hypothetical protein
MILRVRDGRLFALGHGAVGLRDGFRGLTRA